MSQQEPKAVTGAVSKAKEGRKSDDMGSSAPSKVSAPQKAEETMRALAKRWGVQRKTASLWKREGAPVHDDELLARWLVTRKEIAAGARAKIAEMTAAKQGGGENDREPVWGGGLQNPEKPENGEDAAPAVEGIRGAAHALRRQEDEELASYQRLQAAIVKGDPWEIKEARAAWLKTCESLRRFDLLVESARRDAGELLPRAEWTRMARAIVFWFMHAINRAEDEIAPELVGHTDTVSAWRVLDAALVDKMGEAFAFACRRDSGLALPEWAVKDVLSALHTPLKEIPAPQELPSCPTPAAQ